MDIRFAFHEHPSDDIWEDYAFGRLIAERLASAEEHLLVCQRCQATLAETDEFILLMKSATDGYAVRAKQRRAGKLLTFPGAKRAACAGVAAAALAAVAWIGFPTSPAATVPITLRSFRGVTETGNRAPAKHPLELTVPSATLPSAVEYRFEVVTATGGPVWSGQAEIKGGMLSAHIPRRLGAGLYWVRLYAQGSRLLAEYGLRME